MNKITVGLIIGALLGSVDGMTAWFTPEVRNEMVGIIIGSTFKGLLTGLAAGFFARKVNSTLWGVVLGLCVQLALSYMVAAMQDKYYLEIMLPGSIVGAIVGFATQRYPSHKGAVPAAAAR